MFGILLADTGWIRSDAAFVLAATAAALGIALPTGAVGRCVLALVLAATCGAGAMGRKLEQAARWSAVGPREVTLEATVATIGRTAASWRVDLEDARSVGDEPVAPPPRLRLYGRPTPDGVEPFERALPGECVRLRARLRPPRGLRNPGGAERERALRRAGTGARGSLVHPALHVALPEHTGWRPLARLWQLRATLAERLFATGPGGGLLAALAVGNRSGLSSSERDAFARLGLAHLLAVSGLHLALLTACVFLAVRRGPGRWAWLAARCDARLLALGAAGLCACVYALLAGWGIPVRRALILLAAAAAALARGRPTLRLSPLALAALVILALEPEALFAVGAQLSFVATAALLLASRHPVGGVGGALRTSAAALAATAPLAAWALGSRAPLALLANAVAVPWIGFVLLPAALGAACLAAFAPADLAELGGVPAARLAAATLDAAVGLAEHAPGEVGHAPPAHTWLLASILLGLCALAARPTALRLALTLAVAGVLWWAPALEVDPAPPRVLLLDVGQGDATLVQGRRGVLLVDGGVALPDGPDLGRRAVVPALRALGVRRLDLVAASHADLDHRGGLVAVLREFPTDTVWLPYGGLDDGAFAELLAVARARGVAVHERGQGDPPAILGDLRVTPLWPPQAGAQRAEGERRAARNDRSLVLRVEVAGRRVLLPGDIEARAEAALVASGQDLRADVLKLPHHGSRSSSTAELLAATAASVAVASAPCQGRFRMPHREVRERVRQAGLALWWTGRDGAVRVGLEGPLHVLGTGAPRRCP